MKSRLQSLLIIVIIINVIAFGAVGFLWMAIRGTIKQSVQNIIELENARFREQNVKALREAIIATESERALLSSHFISEDEAVDVLEKVETIGKASDTLLNLSVINWREKSQTEGPALEISATIKGSFSGVYHAISMIERLPYKIEIKKIATLENNSEKNGRFWEAQITFIITSIL